MSFALDFRAKLHAEHKERRRRFAEQHCSISIASLSDPIRDPLAEAVEAAQIAIDRATRWKPVARAVCEAHGFTFTEALNGGRTRPYVRCRQAIFYHLSAIGFSRARIAHMMGGLDHTTVAHGIMVHAKRHGLPLPVGIVPTVRQWEDAFAEGLNTFEIAKKFGVYESQVVRSLHRRREARRAS